VYVGGFSSEFSLLTSITDCYAWGNVTGNTSQASTGGFASTLRDGTITNCYAIGLLTGDTTGAWGGVGGISYYTRDMTIENCFWDTDTSEEADGIGSDVSGNSGTPQGHVTSWMKTRSNYESAGWDFDTVWQVPDPTTWASLGLGVVSIATIPSADEDEIWLIAYRYINGQLVRYLEQMQPRDWGDDDEDQWFVDSGLDYDSTAATVFSGFDHLEGEEVAILADGAVVENQTVTNGTITLDDAASRVIAGLPFRYKLKPMRLDLTGAGGTTQTAIKNIAEIVVSFYKSNMVEYGTDVDNLFKIAWRTTESHGSPPELFTGNKLLNPEGGFDPEDGLILTGNAPVNCTIRALIPRIQITGR
jgi:hypothetical protein